MCSNIPQICYDCGQTRHFKVDGQLFCYEIKFQWHCPICIGVHRKLNIPRESGLSAGVHSLDDPLTLKGQELLVLGSYDSISNKEPWVALTIEAEEADFILDPGDSFFAFLNPGPHSAVSMTIRDVSGKL